MMNMQIERKLGTKKSKTEDLVLISLDLSILLRKCHCVSLVSQKTERLSCKRHLQH